MTPATATFATPDEGILRCAVGDEQYAFRMLDVRHVTRAEQLRDDPNDDGRIGSLRVAGQQVPVFALGRVLGRPGASAASRNPDQHVAVTGGREGLVGWLVDRMARTPAPARESIAPIPRSVGSPASKWFEALVTFDADDSALLIAPQHLNPLAPPPAAELINEPVFVASSAAARDPQTDAVAVLFSTDRLPPSPARRYALSGRQIAAVVQPSAPIAVPGAATHVLGITRWRHSVVPVVAFRNGGGRSNPERRLIAQAGASGTESLVAFSIDTEIVMHRPGSNHTLMSDVACPSFCTGLFDVDGEVVGLLDLDALLREPS